MDDIEGLGREKDLYVWKNGKLVRNIDAIDILIGVWISSVLLFCFFLGFMIIGPWERYIEIYFGVYVITVFVIESVFYAFIIWLLKRAGERNKSANKVIMKCIGVAILAVAIGIFTPLCRCAPDLDNWILNDTEELTDVVKSLQVEKIQRGGGRGIPGRYDYRAIVITENHGSFKFVDETDEELEVLKDLKVGDRVKIHYLPQSKIPTGIEHSSN